jgi:hypothetical protein
VSGELVVANAMTAPDRWLRLADAIYSATPRPLAWLHAVLASCPGCAVVAAGARDGECTVVTRTAFHQNKLRLRVAVTPAGSGALVCAIFVHAWLTAGWPPAAIDRARLVAVGWESGLMAGPVTRVRVALYCELSGSSSRSEISSASGASMAE